MPRRIDVRERVPADEPEVGRFLAERHSGRVARLGRLERPLDHPALVARRDGRLAVDAGRATLKPEIPRSGEHGIPLRDELILEKEVVT